MSDDSVTYKQVLKMIEDSHIKTTQHIDKCFVNHEKQEMLRDLARDKVNDTQDADIDGLKIAIYGNGRAGIKEQTDWLWRTRHAIWLLTVSVIGKVLYDVLATT